MHMCIAIRYTLVRLCQTPSLLPGPLPTVASASLRLYFLLLYSEHINHIQVLGFFPSPNSSCALSPLSVTHVQSYYCICLGSIVRIWPPGLNRVFGTMEATTQHNEIEVLKMLKNWVLVTHACNPSYLRGWDWESCG
jgi:hypothetical protein